MLLLAALPLPAAPWEGGRRLPSDLAACEVRELGVGAHFRHDGELWVRLAPDPDREDDSREARPRVLAARLTGPEEWWGSRRGVPRPLFARCWVRPVVSTFTRAREPWE